MSGVVALLLLVAGWEAIAIMYLGLRVAELKEERPIRNHKGRFVKREER